MINNDYLDRLRYKVNHLTSEPGVYKMLDRGGHIIYVGKAKNLKRRVSSYFVDTKKPEKVMRMVENVYDFEYIVVKTEAEALSLESNLIKQNMPFYNILLKDGKAFPYIRINLYDEYPYPTLVRKIKKDNAKYYGPYFGAISGTTMMKVISSAFKLRDCNVMNKRSACLNYHIHTCLAPCIGKCTKEEYRQEVNRLIDFLRGDTSYVVESLKGKMKAYSDMQDYEHAIEARDSIEALSKMQQSLITGINRSVDIDIFGFGSTGEMSAVTIGNVRGGKLIGMTSFDIIDHVSSPDEILQTFIADYYSKTVIIPEEIVVGVDTGGLAEYLNNKIKEYNASINKAKMSQSGYNLTKSGVVITNPKIGVKYKLLEMANKNAIEYCNKGQTISKQHEVKTMGAVNRLHDILKLKNLPLRIEGYDISNLGGTNTVASMVVFVNGERASKMYRKFRIPGVGQNDFDNMRNILRRRLDEYVKGEDVSFSCKPDLILIDGGAIQLQFANESLRASKLDCDIISLAKREEEIYVPGRVDTVKLSKDDVALKLLQAVRDESHRFAITFQRSTRLKTLSSALDEVPMLGKTKINALYQYFGDIDKIKSASVDELMQVPGIGKMCAESIIKALNK